MKESFRERQLDNKCRVSRYFERVWEIPFHPQDYSVEEIEKARNFLLGQHSSWEIAINSPGSPVPREELDMIFAGLFHHGITHPPTIKGAPNVN